MSVSASSVSAGGALAGSPSFMFSFTLRSKTFLKGMLLVELCCCLFEVVMAVMSACKAGVMCTDYCCFAQRNCRKQCLYCVNLVAVVVCPSITNAFCVLRVA